MKMSVTRRLCIQWLASIASRRTSPSNEIPLTGRGSLKNNFYSLTLEQPDKSYAFLVRSMKAGNLKGLHFDRIHIGRRGLKGVLKKHSYSGMRVKFVHYYKGIRFTYYIYSHAILHHYSKFYFFYMIYNNVYQFFFNRKKLTNLDRYEILKLILNNNIDDERGYQNVLALVDNLYPRRWINRPDHPKILNYYTLVVDSLIKSGDVEKLAPNGYRITANGLTTVSAFETDNRRHTDNVRQQTILAILTFALVLIGLGQLFVDGSK